MRSQRSRVVVISGQYCLSRRPQAKKGSSSHDETWEEYLIKLSFMTVNAQFILNLIPNSQNCMYWVLKKNVRKTNHELLSRKNKKYKIWTFFYPGRWCSLDLQDSLWLASLGGNRYLFEKILDKTPKLKFVFPSANFISHILLAFGASVNITIYCICDRRFYVVVQKTLR